MVFLVDVEAKLEVQNMYDAPAIRFSYPGSADLGQLWRELQAIGWLVPEPPTIPYQASNWVGTHGRNEAHEYRVEDFEVTTDQWPLVEIADRGMQTINLLRRRGVDVRMPISYLDFLRKTQLQQKAGASRSAVVERTDRDVRPSDQRDVSNADVGAANPADGPLTARPRLSIVPDAVDEETPESTVNDSGRQVVEVPQIVLLSTKAWSVLRSEPGLEVYQSVVVPGRTRWTWSETFNNVEQLGSTLPDPRILFETVELGWERKSVDVPRLEVDHETERTLWFIAHQFPEATELVTFLQKQPGTTAAVVHMSPLPRTTAFDDCFLVGAVVPAAMFSKIGSRVVSNHGDVIARGRLSPLADTETTFSR